MSIIEAITQLKKEVRVDEKTGVGFISIRGAARLVDVSDQNIRLLLSNKTSKAVEGVSKLSENLTRLGFDGAVEEVKEITDLVLSGIIEYYTFND